MEDLKRKREDYYKKFKKGGVKDMVKRAKNK